MTTVEYFVSYTDNEGKNFITLTYQSFGDAFLKYKEETSKGRSVFLRQKVTTTTHSTLATSNDAMRLC